MCLLEVEVPWEIGVRWGRGSSAQEGLGQEKGFDLGSKKRGRIQQVGMQGEGNLTGPDSKGREGEFRMESHREGGCTQPWRGRGGGGWEVAEGFDSLKGGETTASQTAQRGRTRFFVLFVF